MINDTRFGLRNFILYVRIESSKGVETKQFYPSEFLETMYRYVVEKLGKTISTFIIICICLLRDGEYHIYSNDYNLNEYVFTIYKVNKKSATKINDYDSLKSYIEMLLVFADEKESLSNEKKWKFKKAV